MPTAKHRPRPFDHTQGRPQTVAHLLNEGARLLHSQRPAEALPPLRKAYRLAPDDPDVAVNLGGALVMNAKWSEAVRFLEQALVQHPDNTRLWINLAAAHLGRLPLSSFAAQDKAIAAYQRALELDPIAFSVHYNVGLIYAERQDWPQAEHWFQAALRANPADKDAAFWLRRVQAVQAQAEANDMNPSAFSPD